MYYYADSTEKQIGFCSDLQWTVRQGQKPIFTVDSPFPVELAQGAAGSYVTGTMTLYLPKGSTPESAGLVPYRVDPSGNPFQSSSKFMSLRLYDRNTTELVGSADYAKVGEYTVMVKNRSYVVVQLSFAALYWTPGNVQ